MKPSELPSEYLELAKKRAEQEDGGKDTDEDDLGYWFSWQCTPEGDIFWGRCDMAQSIDELPPIRNKRGDSVTDGSINDMVSGARAMSDDTSYAIKGFGRSGGPDHYSSMEIEPSEYIIANDMSWCEANVIKYVSRHKKKGGESDIRKAIDYLEQILSNEYNNGDN